MADVAELAIKITAAIGGLQGDLRKAEAAFEKSMGGMASSSATASVALGNLAAQGVMALGNAIMGALSDVIAMGDELGNMSAKTGVSMSALQEWGFAAESTGSSLDTVAAASAKLGVNLVEGSKGTMQALKELGLSQAELLAMNPEQRFEAIAAAIGKIPDPANRAALETALLGKSGVELDPAIQNFQQLTEEAQKLGIVIGDETLAAAGEFGSQMDILKTQGMAMIAEFLRPFLPMLADLAKSLTELARQVFPWIQQAVFRFLIDVTGLQVALLKFVQGVRQTATDIPILGRIMGLSATSAKFYTDEIAKGEAELAKLKAQAAGTAPVVVAATDQQTAAVGRLGDANDKAAEAAKKLREEEQKRIDKLTGAAAVAAAKQVIADLDKIGNVSDIAQDQLAGMNRVLLAGLAVLKDAPPRWRKVALDIDMATDAVKEHTRELQNLIMVVPKTPVQTYTIDFVPSTPLPDFTIPNLEPAVQKTLDAIRKTEEAHARIKASVTDLAFSITDAAIQAVAGGGNIAGAMAMAGSDSILSSLHENEKAFGSLGKAMGMAATAAQGFATGLQVAGQTGSRMAGVLTGVMAGALSGFAFGGWVGAGIGAIGGLVGGLSASSVSAEDARRAFSAANGGLQELNRTVIHAGLSLDEFFMARNADDVNVAIANLQNGLAAFNRETAAFVASLQQVADGGELLGRGTLEWLSKIEPGTQEAAAAMEFFAQQTASAATGLQTFLENATISSQASADALTASMGAIFEDFRLQGMTSGEALAALSPAILKMQAQLDAAGLQGGAAFGFLAAQANLTADEVAGPLYTAIGGLGQLMTGLANTGRMNQEIFGGLTSQITATWDELVKMGKGGAAGMALIAPELQHIWELQKDYEFAVDDSTQALLDEAEASGLVGEKFRSDQDKMTKAIETLVTRMGELVTILSRTLPGAAATGATSVQRSLDGIRPPTIVVPVVYDYQNEGPDGSSSGGGGGIEGRGVAAPSPVIARMPAGLSGAALRVGVSVNVDGERIAEAATRYTGRVLAPYGVGAQ